MEDDDEKINSRIEEMVDEEGELIDKDTIELMINHDIDKDTAEKAQELIDEGFDEEDAIEFADEL